MNHLDLFSGIGGFTLGLKQAGFKIKNHFFSEVDKHTIAIYQQQFKEAQYVGSVTDVRGSDLPSIDIITFGSPCQDFSLAGKRKGLDGERSCLIAEAIRLIAECQPDIFIWENVKGTFSSNAGADFWSIIQAFTDIGGYRIEWQLLNTAWFLPQNRERIYLVGLIADKCGGQIFPIGETIEICNGRNKVKKEVHANNRTAITQCARQYSSWCGDFVRVGTWRTYKDKKGFKDGGGQPAIKIDAVRGRNPRNSKSRKAGLPTEQMLEINENGTSNTLTSVYKDNYVVEPEKIRRLTEIECERLQGFPDNYTKYGNYDGEIKEVSATQRYKCLGNAVTVDVVKAVGRAILND
jgi:DNA (cytosine-5)-methyltransferase 1